jgi:uncharacterized membrane protein YczE
VTRAIPLAKRSTLLVVGSLVSTLCYALTIRARIGLGPLYAVQDGIAGHIGITIGQAVMLVGIALVAACLALRSWPGPGTIALPFLGGFLLDRLLPHLPEIHGLPLQLAVVAAASWVMALGGAIIIRASVGIAALDGVMMGIHRIWGRPLAPIRLAMEGVMLVAGWLLGGTVGLGTVITGLLIGPGLQFWVDVLGGDPAVARRTTPSAAHPSVTLVD